VEDVTMYVKDGNTNYFQLGGNKTPSAPRNTVLTQQIDDDKRVVKLTWDTAYAGNEPLKYYEIYRDNEKIGRVDHSPQVDSNPFSYSDDVRDNTQHEYKIVTVDFTDRSVSSDAVIAESFG
jgi:hypothetical protein